MAVLESARDLRLLWLEARFKVRLEDGRRIFVKASGCDLPDGRSHAFNLIDRERICLDVLKGLAVPERVTLTSRQMGRWVAGRSRAVAAACVPGRDLDKAGLSHGELLGAWAFVAEQLAAFRRRQILYTDVKCRNLVARRRPLAVVVIDFNLGTCLSPCGTYRNLGFTQGFQAPEHRGAKRLTERALVYQLGMLLPHCWMGVTNSVLRDPRRGLAAFRGRLRARGAAGVADIVDSALAPRPGDRPRNYEEMWAAIRGDGRGPLPPEALEAWRRLRAPYARQLGELGLHDDRR